MRLGPQRLRCGRDGRAAVVRGVCAQEDRPGRAGGSQGADGPQGIGHDPAGAAGGTGGALAQAARDYHRGAAASPNAAPNITFKSSPSIKPTTHVHCPATPPQQVKECRKINQPTHTI